MLVLETDMYLTDGHRLYRVASPVLDNGGLVELEDCLTLDVIVWRVEEVVRHGFEPVVRRAETVVAAA